MRNLKRALSMLLSSTMVLGMVAMGGSAAGYQDVDGTNNQEAIEVLQAVGIMTGDENGNFNPDGIVTRNEMAVIMSNLMAYNVATYAGTSPFTDVPEWAEPYVAACYTNGITAGISDTLYGGDQTVTTSQAALMIMKALGYFQYQSDFGSDWQLSSITQGNKIDLFDKVNSGVKDPMTRNDVAQLVLNGLKSGTVMAETSGTITVGDTTIVNGVKYNYVTSQQDYAYTISGKQSTTDYTDAGASIVELGEKLYQGDLTLDSYMENLNTDVFGRPANTWEYQAKEIGTYSQDADVSFDDTVTYKEMYDAVGNTATGYTWYVTVDGEKLWDWNAVTGEPENFKYAGRFISENKTNDNDCFLNSALVAVNGTGNGVRTNVYVDGTKKAVYVSVTHYYAAEVYEVNDGSITLSNLHDYEGYEVADTDDVYETSGSYAEDDIVMYSFADDKIQEVYAATSVEGNVERVRVNPDDEDGDYYDIDGTRYKYNTTVDGDARLQPENVNNSMVGYLDQYGYTAYIDESAVSYDYAYVLSMGSDDDLYGGGASTIYARLVLTDGSVVKVETNVKASSADADYNDNGKKDIEDAITTFENHIVSYTVDQNGVYTLVNRDLVEDGKMQGTTGTDAAPSKDELFIENGVAAFKAGLDAAGKVMSWTANSNTVFIVAESDNQSIEDYDYYVYTGVKNVPDIEGIAGAQVCVAADKNGVAKVVYIQDADVSGAGQVIFARADSEAKLVRDTKIGDFREIAAVVDGEVVTLNVKTGTEAENKLTGTMIADGIGQRLNDEQRIVALESVTTNADGLVTNVRAYDPLNDGDGWKTYYGTGKHTKETVILGGDASTGEAFAYYEDIDVARYDTESKSFKVSTVTSVKTDSNDSALGVFSSGVLNGLCIIERPLGVLPEIEVANGNVTVVVDLSEMPAVEDVQNPTIDKDTNTLTFEVPVNVSNAVAKARAASEEYKYTLVWEGTLTYTVGDVTKSKTMEGTADVVDGVATISIDLPETYDSAVFTLTSATLTKELVDGGENPPAAEDEATIFYNKDATKYAVTGDGNFKVADGATVTVTANEGYVITGVTANNDAAKVTSANGVYTITVAADAVEAGTEIVITIVADEKLTPDADLSNAPGVYLDEDGKGVTIRYYKTRPTGSEQAKLITESGYFTVDTVDGGNGYQEGVVDAICTVALQEVVKLQIDGTADANLVKYVDVSKAVAATADELAGFIKSGATLINAQTAGTKALDVFGDYTGGNATTGNDVTLYNAYKVDKGTADVKYNAETDSTKADDWQTLSNTYVAIGTELKVSVTSGTTDGSAVLYINKTAEETIPLDNAGAGEFKAFALTSNVVVANETEGEPNVCALSVSEGNKLALNGTTLDGLFALSNSIKLDSTVGKANADKTFVQLTNGATAGTAWSATNTWTVTGTRNPSTGITEYTLEGASAPSADAKGLASLVEAYSVKLDTDSVGAFGTINGKYTLNGMKINNDSVGLNGSATYVAKGTVLTLTTDDTTSGTKIQVKTGTGEFKDAGTAANGTKGATATVTVGTEALEIRVVLAPAVENVTVGSGSLTYGSVGAISATVTTQGIADGAKVNAEVVGQDSISFTEATITSGTASFTGVDLSSLDAGTYPLKVTVTAGDKTYELSQEFTIKKKTEEITVQKVTAAEVSTLDITMNDIGTLAASDFTIKFVDSDGEEVTIASTSYTVGTYSTDKYVITFNSDKQTAASGDYFKVTLNAKNYESVETSGEAAD